MEIRYSDSELNKADVCDVCGKTYAKGKYIIPFPTVMRQEAGRFMVEAQCCSGHVDASKSKWVCDEGAQLVRNSVKEIGDILKTLDEQLQSLKGSTIKEGEE